MNLGQIFDVRSRTAKLVHEDPATTIFGEAVMVCFLVILVTVLHVLWQSSTFTAMRWALETRVSIHPDFGARILVDRGHVTFLEVNERRHVHVPATDIATDFRDDDARIMRLVEARMQLSEVLEDSPNGCIKGVEASKVHGAPAVLDSGLFAPNLRHHCPKPSCCTKEACNLRAGFETSR